MATLEEIQKLPRGATFWRADLHIHSYPASHDVKDTTATPQAIVASAANEGLKIIAIADHNEISGVAAAITASTAAGVLVIPAVELSTQQGHLLCYLPTLEALKKFHAQLKIVDNGTQNSRCQDAMFECLEKLKAFNGFAMLAHVDAGSGLEQMVAGNTAHKTDIICHPALLGIELKSAASTISYSERDPDRHRAENGKERIKRNGLGARQYLARVLNSDSHSLKSLGRNAAGDRKVTRYKMQGLNFESLRIALDDADARVRIEDEIPLEVPYVRGLALNGGFLDGQHVHFSPNLNCIIGGRGTGKSTTFEAIKVLMGHECTTDIIDSEVWPDHIDLYVEDQAGQSHQLTRMREDSVYNPSEDEHAPISFQVECYGQGETQKISQRAQTDPLALLEYLDRFVQVRDDWHKENAVRDDLLKSQSDIETAVRQVEKIPKMERDLNHARTQLNTLEKAKAAEIIVRQRKIEAERQIRVNVAQSASSIASGLVNQEVFEEVAALKTAADPAKLQVGSAEFKVITAEVVAFEASLRKVEGDLRASSTKLSGVVNSQITAWRTKEQTLLQEIGTQIKELERQGVRVDIQFIQKLTADEARMQSDLEKLKKWEPHLQKLRRDRKVKVTERWALRAKIAAKRAAFAQKASAILKEALSGLNVSLKFEENGYSPEAKTLIVDVMGWRTQQVPRVDLLTQVLTVPKLLAAIDKNEAAAITALTMEDGTKPFSKADAEAIIERFSLDINRFRLERCEVFDRPRLLVTKMMELADGTKKALTKEFRQLSLGQQQSVLLALMLSSDSNCPLIIDQPEDNLDGEFIYHSLVPVLRRAKERRQVIIVTHNANIAVLGDAEQIIVLKGTNEKGQISLRGSIDDNETREAACGILEGSREAFQRRSRVYGPKAPK